MPDGLYDADILLWSQAQADLLRRLQAGERVNERVDWSNLIEEIEDLGRSELNACRSLLRRALTHLLKLDAWPASRSAGHWRAEIQAFLADAEQSFTPSMRQKIDLAKLYSQALLAAGLETDESGAFLPVRDTCPYTLDQLLAADAASLCARASP